MARANLKRLEEGKLYYSISEVCSMTGLEQHVLRYWESEFPQLRPKKNRSGNRAYRNKEIKIIRYIKYLLYDELYTIPGAKKKMAEANLSDLEGQMTLIRVPAAPARDKDSHAADPGGHGAGNGRAVVPPAPEAEYGDAADSESDAHAGEGDFPEPAPGPEARASEDRLRGELLRMLEDLKGLLAHLRSAGAAPAPEGGISLETSAIDEGGGPRLSH